MKKMRLMAVSLLFLILFNDPVLSIANRPILVAGIPLLYITSAWLVLILLIAFIIHQHPIASDTPEADE